MPELKLGPYRILDEIGSGGMGVVYRAYDERLEREVALKVVPLDGHAARRDRARLFEEARAASSLAHPGIVSIFDVGEALTAIGSTEGAAEERLVGWIAMERVVGRTLEAVFQEGPVPLPRLLALLTPVADALARAHASGLVHRDVKPANVMVTADGFPKVLDFGLAQREVVSGVDRTLVKTREGMVVGTAAYMSPEQASGQTVDFRSDQFSFGAVLFEGLTGQRPFTGRNDVDVMHAILHADPPPARLLAPGTPDSVCWILEKCLAKEPRDRYQSTLDLVIDLKRAGEQLSRSRPTLVSVSASRPPRRVRLSRAALVAALLLVCGLLAGRFLRPAPAGLPSPRITAVAGSTGADWAEGVPSPAGRAVALTSNLAGSYDIWVVADGGDPVRRTDAPEDETEPCFSPDGATIVYTKETAEGDELWAVPAVGGAPRRLLPGAGAATFTPDGRRLVYVKAEKRSSSRSALYVANADGTGPRLLAEKKGFRLASPRVSPDGLTVAFVATRLVQSEVNVWTVPLAGGEPMQLTHEKNPYAHGLGTNGCDFTPDGRSVVYTSARKGTRNLWSVPLKGSGEPRRVTAGAGPDVYPRFAADGSMLFEVHRERWSIWGVALGPDLTSRDAPHLLTRDGGAWGPALSPDGTKLAYCTFPHEEVRHVYVVDLATKERIRISSAGPRNANPTFSPDGRTIIWYGDSAGSYDLWSAPALGGPPKRLTALPGAEIRPYFFDDGRRVAFARIEEGKGVRVGVLDLDTKESLLVTPEGFGEPRPLPGGRALVCSGDREGGPTQGIWLVPSDGSSPPRRIAPRGYRPFPSGDGKWILFLENEDGLCLVKAIPVSGGEARVVYRIPATRNFLQADLSLDGRLLAYNVIDAESTVWRWEP